MKKAISIFGHCLDWRGLALLAVGGAALTLYAPRLALVAVPVLLALACPISMLLMVRGLSRRRTMSGGASNAVSQRSGQGLSSRAHLMDLRDEFRHVQAQHAAVTERIAFLEGDSEHTATISTPGIAER